MGVVLPDQTYCKLLQPFFVYEFDNEGKVLDQDDKIVFADLEYAHLVVPKFRLHCLQIRGRKQCVFEVVLGEEPPIRLVEPHFVALVDGHQVVWVTRAELESSDV